MKVKDFHRGSEKANSKCVCSHDKVWLRFEIEWMKFKVRILKLLDCLPRADVLRVGESKYISDFNFCDHKIQKLTIKKNNIIQRFQNTKFDSF